MCFVVAWVDEAKGGVLHVRTARVGREAAFEDVGWKERLRMQNAVHGLVEAEWLLRCVVWYVAFSRARGAMGDLWLLL